MEITLGELRMLSPRERKHVLEAMCKIAAAKGQQPVRLVEPACVAERERRTLMRWLAW
jgi:hypothetical protein